MRRILMALSILVAVGLPANAQDVQPRNAEIESTIKNQIDAFKADDFTTAFDFAAPNIQGLFGTPENFGAMVRGGYPMVWRPRDLRFGELTQARGRLFQTVIVQDQQGVTHALAYAMVQLDGEWRIAGVQVIPPPDVSA